MDEIKPVAFANPQAFVNFRERGHLGGVYGREWMWAKHHPEFVPLYDQQAIDTLRAEIEENEGVIRVWRGRTERAEAELEALRWVVEQYVTLQTDGGGRWRVEFGYTSPVTYGPWADSRMAAIDAAKQAAE